METGHEEEGVIPLPLPGLTLPEADTLEREALLGFRLWHVIFMAFAGVTAVVVCVCCCVRFRIPRTKQEIEADFVRKKITRKFQKQLRLIQNAEMDEMDLKRALDRVRAEFRSETASLAASEEAADDSVFNDDTPDGRKRDAAGDAKIDEMIKNKQKCFGDRISSLVGFLRWRRSHQQTQASPTKLAV